MSENSFLKGTPIRYIKLLNFIPFLSFILFFFFFFFGHKYLFHKHPWSCRNDCNIFKIIKFIKRKLKIFIITNSIAIAQCMSTCKSECTCTSKMVVCYQLRSWWDFMRVDEKRGLRTTILRGRVCFILLYH